MSEKWNGAEPNREEVLAEIARELAMRRKVFPRWVENGKLTQKQSDERIDRLQKAYDYLQGNWTASQRTML